MVSLTRSKRTAPVSFRGRGVTVALLAFNLAGGGSNPSGPIFNRKITRTGRLSREDAARLRAEMWVRIPPGALRTEIKVTETTTNLRP